MSPKSLWVTYYLTYYLLLVIGCIVWVLGLYANLLCLYYSYTTINCGYSCKMRSMLLRWNNERLHFPEILRASRWGHQTAALAQGTLLLINSVHRQSPGLAESEVDIKMGFSSASARWPSQPPTVGEWGHTQPYRWGPAGRNVRNICGVVVGWHLVWLDRFTEISNVVKLLTPVLNVCYGFLCWSGCNGK